MAAAIEQEMQEEPQGQLAQRFDLTLVVTSCWEMSLST